MPIGPFDDEDFEAEHDMRVLSEAEEIKNDASRRARAKARAQELAQQFSEQAERMDGGDDLDKGYTSLGKLNLGDD